MLIGPQLRWRRDAAPLLAAIAIPALVVAGAVLVGWLVLAPQIGLLPRLGLALAAALAAGQPAPLFGRNLSATPLARLGHGIAHFGVAVALARHGVRQRLHPGEAGRRAARRHGSRSGRGWSSSGEVEPVAGPNWTAIEAELAGLARSGRRSS